MKILHQNIDELAQQNSLQSYKKIYRIDKYSSVKRWTIAIFIICFLVMFLPWTQNIKASGSITTLKQENRPQEINTVLSGSIAKWFIKEGDF